MTWLFKFIWQLFLCIDLIIATLILYLLTYLPKNWTQNWYPRLFQMWCWIFMYALGVNLKCHQKNVQPLPKHYILIGNHPSILEDLGMPALFNARFLAKRELKDWWIVGRMSVATGTLYVKRDEQESRAHAKELLTQTLLNGHNVALYPEGGCHGRKLYLPFLPGAFSISIKTGIHILPVFLHYEAQEEFEWQPQETVIQKLWKIFRAQNKNANYYVFDAIDPKQFENKESMQAFVENLYINWQKKYLE